MLQLRNMPNGMRAIAKGPGKVDDLVSFLPMNRLRGDTPTMDTTDKDTKDRLEAFETKLAYQEAALSDMSAMLNEYRIRVDRLESSLRSMASRLAETAESKAPGLPLSERPPHY